MLVVVAATSAAPARTSSSGLASLARPPSVPDAARTGTADARTTGSVVLLATAAASTTPAGYAGGLAPRRVAVPPR